MAVTAYNLITARNPHDMNVFVTAAIADDWQPQGGVAVTTDGLFVQTMVQLADEEPVE